MGQRKADRQWSQQRRTRHVWIVAALPYEPPTQGFVIEWRRVRQAWWALTLHLVSIEDREVVVQEWISIDRLRPVPADPERSEDIYRSYRARYRTHGR